jgi:hypothetical protein
VSMRILVGVIGACFGAILVMMLMSRGNVPPEPVTVGAARPKCDGLKRPAFDSAQVRILYRGAVRGQSTGNRLTERSRNSM